MFLSKDEKITKRRYTEMEEKKIVFYNPKEAPFEIFGLYEPKSEETYKRLPDEVGMNVSEGVASVYRHTAGGRVRFATDSSSITIRVKYPAPDIMYHATHLMENGFDLYIDGENRSRFAGSFIFSYSETREYESKFPRPLPEGDKEFTINFPLYGGVESLEIGLDEGARIWAHTPYKHDVPIVFYGSSITQGGCAARPGLSYEARISREYDCDYINLGFSGSARAEDIIVDYMAGLKMSAFVSDYDHNTPSDEHLKNTHYKMYEKIRAKNPDIPYIMITKPDFKFHTVDMSRRDIIMQSYLKARENGDNNVWFIDGSSFFAFGDRGDYTVDATHPTDVGFERMALMIGHVIREIFKW